MKTQRTFLFCLVLAGITLALYWKATSFDFIRYDDNDYVTRNREVQAGLTWEGVKWAFDSSHASNWHPLTWLSHMLDCELSGLRAGRHHLTNILFHAANAVLLFLVLSRMTGASWQSFLVAALFAWHPAHVESVAWVAERKDVLSTFFLFLTLGTYTLYGERSKIGWYLLTLLFFTMALLSKAMVVTLPCLLLLLDYWPLGRIKKIGAFNLSSDTQPAPAARASFSRLLIEKIPFFTASLVSCILTVGAQRKGGAIMSAEVLPLGARAQNAALSYAEYLHKLFWPSRLAVFYPLEHVLAKWKIALALFILLAISAITLCFIRSRPYLLVGWSWFLGTLVPVIGIVQVGGQALADRYTYVPAIGLFIAMIWTASEIWNRWQDGRIVLMAGALAAGVGCLVITSAQLNYWRNTSTLFEHALEVTSRNFVAYTILGGELTETGHPAEAIPYLKFALLYKPTYPDAHFCLGNAYYRLGQLDDAVTSLSEAARLAPKMTEAFNEWGAALTQQGKFAEAEDKFRRALKIDPGYPAAKLNLGITLVNDQRPDEAIPLLTEALRVNPNSAKAHLNLAKAFQSKGNLDGAVTHFSRALELRPGDFETSKRLGLLLHLQGHLDDALTYLQAAATARPDDPGCRYEMGLIFSQQGKFGEAIEQYSAALRAQPGYVEALNNLAWIRAANANAEFRNGPEAVQLAKTACELTQNQEPFLLGTLAAAYAEAGQFPEAVAAAGKARDLALAKKAE